MSTEKNQAGTLTLVAGNLSFTVDPLKFYIDVHEMATRLTSQGKTLQAAISVLKTIQVGGDDPEKLKEPARMKDLQGMERKVAELFIEPNEIIVKKN